MILHALLLLAPAITAQEPTPELAVPDLGTPIVAPDGSHVLLLDHDLAWLLAPVTLAPRLGLSVGPYTPSGDYWKGARFSEDGTRLALWSSRGAKLLVDVNRGKLLRRIPPPRSSGHPVTLASPDARILVSNHRGLFTVHDLEKGRLVLEGRARGGLCFSPDGRWLYFCGSGAVERIDLEQPEQRHEVQEGKWDHVRFAGDLLLLGRGDHLKTLDPETGAASERDLEGGGWRLDGVSDDGSIAVLHDPYSRVRAIALPGLEPLWERKAWSPMVLAGANVLWMGSEGIRGTAHDLATGELLFEFDSDGYRHPLRAPRVQDGALLLRTRGGDLARVDSRTGERLELLPGHSLRRVVDAGVLASGAVWVLDGDGGLVTLDPNLAVVLARRELGTPDALARSEDDCVVLVDDKGNGRVFEGPSLTARATLADAGKVRPLPGGERLVAYGEEISGARLLNAADGAVLRVVGADAGELRDVVTSADGGRMAALDTGRRPHLWNGEDPVSLPGAATGVRSIAIDPRGRWLALGTDSPGVQVFDAATGALLKSLVVPGDFIFGGDVRTLGFDHTGSRLIGTTGDFGTVQVWGTAGWLHEWSHEYDGGNPGSLIATSDPADETLWVYGMTNHTQRAFDMFSGQVRADAAGSNLWGFAPGSDVVAAERSSGLVLLEPDGRVRLERMDLGPLGAVVLRGRELSGPPAALRQVFVRIGEELVRGDHYVR